MEHIQPYLDYFAKDPTWAIAVIFLIAFGEALLIIGLFVPSTAVLVGAGMLVGTGHLEFWPVLIATITGAILGDQLSFWAGRLFGDRLKTLWPLKNYKSLVERGEAFVKMHGGKSIAVGRFVPGVKAVVPGIVGMLGMSQLFFLFVNVTSGIFWGVAHVFPGILIGQGLAIAGDLSGRLLFVLLILLALIAGVGWLVRLGTVALEPAYHATLLNISNWSKSTGSRSMYRFGLAVSPKHKQSYQMSFLVFILLFSVAIFIYLTVAALRAGFTSNLDLSLYNLMRETRNSPADDLFAFTSVFGDIPVTISIILAIFIWGIYHRMWRMGLTTLILAFVTSAIALLLRQYESLTGNLSPNYAILKGSFPSNEMLLTTVAFGGLAVLAGHTMGRWSKALLVSLGAVAILLVGFSRQYLGLEWLSDSLAGVFLGLIAVALFGLIVETTPLRKIKPLGLISFSLLMYVLSFSAFSPWLSSHRLLIAEQLPKSTVMQNKDWKQLGWQSLPKQRIDLAGKAEEEFTAQYSGNIEDLISALQTQGWKIEQPWSWKQGLIYLDNLRALSGLPVRPLLHEGLRAKLTATLLDKTHQNTRLVLRVFKTSIEVETNGKSKTLYLISSTGESLVGKTQIYAMPKTRRLLPDESTLQFRRISNLPNVKANIAMGSETILLESGTH